MKQRTGETDIEEDVDISWITERNDCRGIITDAGSDVDRILGSRAESDARHTECPVTQLADHRQQ